VEAELRVLLVLQSYYVHNDVVQAFGEPEKQILIEPVFAQWIQSSHGKDVYESNYLLSSNLSNAFLAGQDIWLPGWLSSINNSTNSLFLQIGPGDLLVHHAIALGLHTTTLILVKGALDARASKLMPDKKDFGYSFPCDGPGRGGTCDISAWDAFYLAVFWMLNTIGWTTFYWHWKHILRSLLVHYSLFKYHLNQGMPDFVLIIENLRVKII
jgi:photosystem I P700 chlorophyll a apoprotein A2